MIALDGNYFPSVFPPALKRDIVALMTTSSAFGRIILLLTLLLGAALTQGVIPAKYAAYAAVVLAALQSFQHPVQQSTGDNTVAVAAIAARPPKE